MNDFLAKFDKMINDRLYFIKDDDKQEIERKNWVQFDYVVAINCSTK